MSFRNLTLLLRILSDRRATRTPISVFRRLRQNRSNRSNEIRNQLSKNCWSRLAAIPSILKFLDGEAITRHDGRWVVNSFLPPFPGEAFDRLFTNLLSERRWSPVSAFIAITPNCPANCWHCSVKNRSGEPVSTEKWLATVEELHRLGASLIGITGGEPLLDSSLESIVRAIRQGGAEPMIFSSGIGLTEERAIALKNAGLWALCVSLDRLNPDEIDQMRQFRGAGISAFEALKNGRKAGLYCCVNCVADRKSVETKLYESLYRKAVELQANEFRLIEPISCGKLLDEDASVFLSPEQIREIRAFHRTTNRRISGFFSGGFNSRAIRTKVCSFNEIESPELFGCAGGTRHLFIDPFGNVCPCDFTPLSFGNINAEPLDVIWDRSIAAMKRPRRRCMAQFQRESIREATRQGIPAPPEITLSTVANFPPEELPDFLQWAEK